MVVPIFGVIPLVTYLTSDQRPVSGSDAMRPQAADRQADIAARCRTLHNRNEARDRETPPVRMHLPERTGRSGATVPRFVAARSDGRASFTHRFLGYLCSLSLTPESAVERVLLRRNATSHAAWLLRIRLQSARRPVQSI
jgi:hypothetical protein